MIRAVAIVALAVAACAPSARTAFHPSDPTFVATPGPLPRVFAGADVAQVPAGPLRSVGIIEVTARASEAPVEVQRRAAARGRALGCSILVEHEAFLRIGARTAWLEGARVELACSAPHLGGHVHAPRQQTMAFDCVITGGLATTRA